MVVVSMLGFGAWFLLYLASDFDPLMAVAGTAVLGLLGLVVGLPALNRIARQQG
jgi:hypothetical protein